MSVLITSGLSPQAWRVNRLLENEDIVFADESELPYVPGVRSALIPPHNSPSFIHEMLRTCLNHGVDRIYSLKWAELRELVKARELYSEYNIRLMVPSDTWLSAQHEHAGINAANLFVIEDGQLLAGVAPPEEKWPHGETGIFSWATNAGKIQYTLYMI
jgi:hypothetical protein